MKFFGERSAEQTFYLVNVINCREKERDRNRRAGKEDGYLFGPVGRMAYPIVEQNFWLIGHALVP